MLTTAKVIDEVLRAPERECHDADGGRLVGAIQKYAGSTRIKVRDIVCLAEVVGHDFLASFPMRRVPAWCRLHPTDLSNQISSDYERNLIVLSINSAVGL